MSIDERQRHELYEGLVEALGSERADTLMELVPPVGWADVATKQDVAHLETVVDLRLEATEARLRKEIADFRTEFHQELRTQLWGILGGIWASIVVAVVLDHLLA
jgi:hypothetical protein